MKYVNLTKKNYILIALLLASILCILAITLFVRDRAHKNELNEANATLFNLGSESPYVDPLGNPVTLESLRGSILIVNSWASWSPFTTEEFPLLETIGRDYKDKNVVVLAINRKETKEQAGRFLATLATLEHVKVIVDTKDFYYDATGGYAMPETLIYNEAGTIVEHIRGTLKSDTLRATLDALVSQEE
jgi:thiol-disulfide isomerase/thioredoxin